MFKNLMRKSTKNKIQKERIERDAHNLLDKIKTKKLTLEKISVFIKKNKLFVNSKNYEILLSKLYPKLKADKIDKKIEAFTRKTEKEKEKIMIFLLSKFIKKNK